MHSLDNFSGLLELWGLFSASKRNPRLNFMSLVMPVDIFTASEHFLAVITNDVNARMPILDKLVTLVTLMQDCLLSLHLRTDWFFAFFLEQLQKCLLLRRREAAHNLNGIECCLRRCILHCYLVFNFARSLTQSYVRNEPCFLNLLLAPGTSPLLH